MLGAVITTSDTLEPIIQQTADKYGVDPALVKAIIKNESDYNPSAYRSEPQINDASWGLMQLLLGTAKQVSGNSNLTASDLLKPEVNIDLGTKYIAQQLNRYGGDVKNAIAAYNAGSARFNSDGSYINQGYVDKVYGSYQLYATVQSVTQFAEENPVISLMPFFAMAVVGIALISRK